MFKLLHIDFIMLLGWLESALKGNQPFLSVQENLLSHKAINS